MENVETLPGNASLRLRHDSRWWNVRFIHAAYCLKSMDLCAEQNMLPATDCQSDRIFGTRSLVSTLAPSASLGRAESDSDRRCFKCVLTWLMAEACLGHLVLIITLEVT